MTTGPGRLTGPVGPLDNLLAKANGDPVQRSLADTSDRNFTKLRRTIDTLTGNLNHYSPQVFNVLGFGAKGDGLSDDTTAIQRAINAAAGYGVGTIADAPYAPTVYFPPGKYIINSNPFKNVIGTAYPVHVVLNGAMLNSSVQIKVPRMSVVNGTSGWDNVGFITRGSPAYVASVSITSVVRASNVVTVTTSSAHGLESNATVRLEGVTNATFDGGFTVTVTGSTTFTYAQTAADATSSGGTCYIPFIVLGDDNPVTFGCRIENLRITMRDESGSVAVYSNTINEESGAENINIQRAAFRGLWVEVMAGGGSNPRAMNYRFENIDIGMTAGTNAVGIYLRGLFDLHRGINNCTIATSSLSAGSGATGIDMSGCPGVYSRIHIEGYTNGILIGNRGSASAAGEDSAAIVLEGITGQTYTTTLVRLKNYGEVNNVVCQGLALNHGTNVLVDEINSVTLTDDYLAWYVLGKTSTGTVLTSSPNGTNRFPANVSAVGDVTAGDDVFVQGGTVTITPSNTIAFIGTDTADASDTATMRIGPGSSASTTRGALLLLSGNEEATFGSGGGYARLTTGNVSGAVLDLLNGIVGLGFSIAQTLITAGLPIIAPFYRDKIDSPSQITSNQDNYNPNSFGWLRLSTDASRDITGFQGGAEGRQLTITNIGAQNIVLVNEATSTAANQIITGTGANITLAPLDTAVLKYDSVSSRWRVISHY